MPTNVLMPQLGESIAEGTIIRWNKSVGDTVDRDEPLFEISTDKVDAEIPSPVAGTLMAIRAPAGETVPVDSVVAVIGSADAGAEADSPPPAVPAVGDVGGTSAAPGPAAAVANRKEGRTVRLSPVVRRLANEHDVDLSVVQGTGAGGRVTKEDVLRYVESRSAPAGRVEPLSTMRRKIAEHMVMSRRTAAHVHTVFEVDFSHVAQLRDARKAEYAAAGAKLTYLSFVAKAVVDAIPEVPVVNAVAGWRQPRLQANDVGLGIAVALDDGPDSAGRQACPRRQRSGTEPDHSRSGGAGPDPAPRAGRSRRRHVHHHQPRCLWVVARDADHQPAATCHSGHGGGRAAPGCRGRRGRRADCGPT